MIVILSYIQFPRNVLPTGLEFLDSGYSSFYALIYLNELHNGPFTRVFGETIVN